MDEIRFPFLTLSGSPFEIGRAHGSGFRKLVRLHLVRVLDRAAGRLGLARDALLSRAMAFRPHVERFMPELADEIGGLARGAGIDLAEAYALQLRAELAEPAEPTEPAESAETGKPAEPAEPTGSAEPAGECSGFAAAPPATSAGEPLVAQNVDLPAYYRELMVVLDLHLPGLPRVLMLTPAGQVSHMGLNDGGLAVGATFVRGGRWGEGLPRYLLTRLALRFATVTEAVEAIRNVPRAASRTLILADTAGQAACLETTPEKCVVVEPHEGLVAHTNHFIHPDLKGSDRMEAPRLRNSTARLERLSELLRSGRGELDRRRARRILSDRQGVPAALSRHRGESPADVMTVASLIMEPAPGRMTAASGPPDRADQAEHTETDLGRSVR